MKFKISAYTTVRNAISMDYPFVESIRSMLQFADEVVVLDTSNGEDETPGRLESLAKEDSRVKVLHGNKLFDWTAPNHGIFDGQTKAMARAACTGQFLWQFDCLAPETQIMTIDGEKSVKDVVVGDLVLTHRGRFRKVLRTYERPEAAYPAFCIHKKTGDTRPLVLTGNHPIWTSDGISKPEWRKLDDGILSPESHYIFPHLKSEIASEHEYRLSIPHGRWAKKDVAIRPSEELGFLVGLFLGDGHIGHDKGVPQYVCFSLSSYQDYVVNRLKQSVKTLFGIEQVSVWHGLGNKKYIRVQIGNQALAKFLLELCGTGSRTKRLSRDVFGWSNAAIVGLIEGLYESDGCNSRSGMAITSVNSSLLSQVKMLLAKIGVFATFSEHHPKEFYGRPQKSFRLNISGKQTELLPFLQCRTSRQLFQQTEDGFLMGAAKFGSWIESITFNGKLYNLEVEEDNSYVANGIVLHNCDELVHEKDAPNIRKIIEGSKYLQGAPILALPVVEYWGRQGKVRVDINPWKPRLSKNLPDITHGIPKHLRRKFNGLDYASPGTDTCDYISKATGMPMPIMGFVPEQIEQLRQGCLRNPKLTETYGRWYNTVIDALPGVFHYSWFNIERKIRQYKLFWTDFWKAMYGPDSVQNKDPNWNPFFEVPWPQVTDEMIKAKAEELETKTGGHIFHTRWTGQVTPHVKINRDHPALIKEWVKTHG